MHSFLTLNRDKLKFQFFMLSLLGLGLVAIVLIISYIFNHQLPNKLLIVAILLGATIGFPLFAIGLGYVSWQIRDRMRRKVFSKNPFDCLGEIGFVSAYSNVESRRYFTREIMRGTIDGFTVLCDVSGEMAGCMKTTIPLAWKKLEKYEVQRIHELLSAYDSSLGMGCVTKLYKVSRTDSYIVDFEEDIKQLIRILRNYGFEPEKLEY